MAADSALSSCLRQIHTLDSFAPLRAFLASNYQISLERLVSLTDDRQVHIAQGEARTWRNLIALLTLQDTSRDP